MEKVKVEQHSGAGMFWVMGWLFSIGFLELGLFRALLAILVWPYFLGDALGLEVFLEDPAPVPSEAAEAAP